MSGYQAVLMAPDGDYVTDHRRDTVEEVEEALANQGSRWYFYPLEMVLVNGPVSDSSRIISAADFYGDGVAIFGGDYVGRTFGTFRREVVALCERAAGRVPCPTCDGAGKVSPEVAR